MLVRHFQNFPFIHADKIEFNIFWDGHDLPGKSFRGVFNFFCQCVVRFRQYTPGSIVTNLQRTPVGVVLNLLDKWNETG